jgi:hypothetical protein
VAGQVSSGRCEALSSLSPVIESLVPFSAVACTVGVVPVAARTGPRSWGDELEGGGFLIELAVIKCNRGTSLIALHPRWRSCKGALMK